MMSQNIQISRILTRHEFIRTFALYIVIKNSSLLL